MTFLYILSILSVPLCVYLRYKMVHTFTEDIPCYSFYAYDFNELGDSTEYSLAKDFLKLMFVAIIPFISITVLLVTYTRLYAYTRKKLHPVIIYGIFGYIQKILGYKND